MSERARVEEVARSTFVQKIEAYATIVLVAGAAAMFAVKAMRLDLPVVDDAAITLSYARTFFGGGGARLTFASAPVEGFSDPLWLFVSGLAFPLHRDPIVFAQHLSIAFGSLAVVATAGFGRALYGRSLQLEDAAAPWILCFLPTFAFWAEAGMETCLYGFLLVVAVLVAIREERTGKRSWSGVAIALLCLTRPEAPLCVLALALFWVGSRALARRKPGKQELRIALWIALLFGGYLAIRWWYFARILPNTYYAKRWWDYQADKYIWSFGQTYVTAIASGGVGALLILATGTWRARRAILLLLAIFCGAVFFAWRSKGDWMPEWRFFAPFCPLLAVTIGGAAVVLRERTVAARSRPWRMAGAIGGIAFLVATLGLVHRDSDARFEEVKKTPGLSADYIRIWGTELGELRDSLGLVHPRFAIPDVGATSLFSPANDMIDAAGLADYAIAEHVDDLPATADYLVSEGMPDLVDIHGQSRIGDAQLKNLMTHYAPWRRSAWLLRGLTKDADPRCPGGLAHVVTLPLPDFVTELRAAMTRKDAPTAIAFWRCGDQHRGDARMPDRATEAALQREAETLAHDASTPLEKLRFRSLATILSHENAHLRRATERLRATLFPPPPAP